MRKILLRSVIVALVVSVLGSLASMLLFGRVGVPTESFSLEKMSTMRYSDAMEYQVANTRTFSGLRYVAWTFSNPRGLLWNLELIGPQFIFAFAGCMWIGLWQRRAGQQEIAPDGRAQC